MSSAPETSNAVTEIKRFEVRYPASEYTYPHGAMIHEVKIDEDYISVQLTDGRILFIPLWWIPSVYNAQPDDRLNFEISRSRTMIIWDPEKGGINDEIRIEDYLAAGSQS